MSDLPDKPTRYDVARSATAFHDQSDAAQENANRVLQQWGKGVLDRGEVDRALTRLQSDRNKLYNRVQNYRNAASKIPGTAGASPADRAVARIDGARQRIDAVMRQLRSEGARTEADRISRQRAVRRDERRRAIRVGQTPKR